MRSFIVLGGLLFGWTPFLVYFVDALHDHDGHQVVLTDTKAPVVPGDDWDLAKEPAKNSTHNLVFDTVASFLQHWPNTRYRNGEQIHSIPSTMT